MECMQAAYDAGCNFFDNAEVYAGGESEAIMGRVLTELGWPRWSYVLTTKVFWGIHDAPNMKNTLNRKYLLHAIDGSLERLGVDFVDVLYCHRSDPDTHARGDGVGDERHRVVGQGAVLGHQRVGGRRDPRRHRDRRAPPPAQAGHRAAAVQPARARARRAGVRPAVRRDRLRRDDLEPAGLRAAHRASTATGIPDDSRGVAGRLRLAGQAAVRRAGAGQGRGPAADRRRARLLAGPAVAGLVHQEPQRVDRHHRRQPPEPGRRELRGRAT